MRRGVLVVAALLVVSAVGPGIVLGAVSGNPNLDVTAPTDTFTAGQQGSLTLAISNAGEIDSGSSRAPNAEQRVMTARGLTVTVEDEGPFDVKTGTVSLGSLPDGGVAQPQFQVSVDEDADPGTYEVPVEVEYTYTARIAEQGVQPQEERTETETFEVELRVTESADVEVVSTDAAVPVGGQGTVTLTYQNSGTETARDASVTVQSGNAGLTFSGSPSASASLGSMEPDETRTVTLSARVAPGSATRSFGLTSTVSYEDGDGVPQQQTLSSGVTPSASDRFVVETTDATVAVGTSGEVGVEVRNAGDEALTDTTVTLQSSNGALTFGGTPSASTFVEEWAPGETRTFVFEAALAPNAEQRPYPLSMTVDYETEDGRTGSSGATTIGVTPAADQSFALGNVDGSLRVGEEGTLSGTLTNEGPDEAENAVLVLQPAGPNVDVPETEFALGDLGARDSVDFQFDVDVSGAASAGPKQFTFQVRYEDDDGTTLQSDPLYARQNIAESRDQFAVDGIETTFAPGESGTLVLQVTNNGDEPVTDISAKLFTDDPVSSSDDEGFISVLEPGESEQVRFGASVSGGAMEKNYPVSVDFQYTDADGDTQLTDTYRVPVTVQQSEDDGGFFSLGWLVDALDTVLSLEWLPGTLPALPTSGLPLAFGRDAGLVAAAGAALVVTRR